MKIFLTLVFLPLLTAAQIFAGEKIFPDIPVEVTEIRNLGLSDSDETKSVIEVHWRVNNTLHPESESFNLTLEVVYADGVSLIFDTKIESSAVSAQVEIPSLHISRHKPPAFIKKIEAFVTMAYPAQRAVRTE